jgi:hypothetical protein
MIKSNATNKKAIRNHIKFCKQEVKEWERLIKDLEAYYKKLK